MESIIKKEEIIELCDKWIEMFKKVHDVFKEVVLDKEYIDQDITMKLSFNRTISNLKTKQKTIDLEIYLHGISIIKGITIALENKNEEVYKYLVANVLNYFILTNCKDTLINYHDNFKGIIYSNIKPRKCMPNPITANITNINGICDYDFISGLLSNHNLKEDYDKVLINYLKNRITDQQLSDEFYSSFKYSKGNYNNIFRSEKPVQKVKTML